ncbi:MAG: hypothetical protein WKG07_05570 [Hymenobacter sp.]
MRGYLDFLKTDVLAAGTGLPLVPHRQGAVRPKVCATIFSRSYSADQVFQLGPKAQGRAAARHGPPRRAALPQVLHRPDRCPPIRCRLIRQVIDQLTRKHAPRDGFVDAVKRQIPTLIKFVNDHDLLTQDPSKPLVVRETPLYMRGSGAGPA